MRISLRFLSSCLYQKSSDAFIVTPEIFVSNLDFFLPRKQKTVLVMNGRNEKFTQAGVGMIFPDSDGNGDEGIV